jgi:putative ABC transport system permease protein
MFKNYLKIAYRSLIKNKAFSIINILGFGFGISICLGITAYLLHEYSFDRYHSNSDHMYRLIDAQNNSSWIDYRVKNILTAQYPEIENACLFQLAPLKKAVAVNNRGYYIDHMLSADNAFFEMFSVPVLLGNKENPLPDINSVVLTERAAKVLFGDADPIGKVVTLPIRNPEPPGLFTKPPLTVTAIIQDFPDHSSIQTQMIVNAENDDFKFYFSCENYADESTHRWPFVIFLSLDKNADKDAFIEKVNGHAELLQPYEEKIGLLALADMYLHDNTRGCNLKQGNPGLLRLLIGIGMAILFLAIINYVNLTTALQSQRYREIGVKKSIGANRNQILVQFLIESVLILLISFLVGIVLLTNSIPIYRSIFYDTFHVYHLFNYWFVLIPVIILLGLISGFSSSFFFAAIHPIKALKGEVFTQKGRFIWRKGLTVFQFAVSIALIFCIIVIQKQIIYVKHNNPGFNEEQLLKLDIPRIQAPDKGKAFLLLNQFRQYSGIISISLTNGVPGQIHNWMGANMEGKDRSLPIILADSSFIRTFGVRVIQGRYPRTEDYGSTCLINESAYQYFEWTDLENKRYNNGRPGGFEVIGVVEDFHIHSLRTAIEPMCILFPEDIYPSHLSIKIAGGQTGQTMKYIEETWQTVLPQYPLNYEFYDAWLDAMYQEDEKIARAIGLFGILAIIISCLGILGMVIFSSQRRTKEIGIRKVVGASVLNILILLTKHFTKWVLLANIFAWPLAWFAMNRWLQNFAYRISIQWWMFILAGALAMMMALLTVSLQIIQAAMANPVKALRYE